MRGQAVTDIEADTNYLWNMKSGLAVAVAADDKEKISEYKEALLMLISVTESRSVKIAAWRAMQTPTVIGNSGTVRPFVRRALPITSATLAIIVAACSLAAVPSQPDPPIVETAVAYELPVCAKWVASCE